MPDQMTDAEINRAVAEAAGVKLAAPSDHILLYVRSKAGVLQRYDPLHDPAQALAALDRVFKVGDRPSWSVERGYSDFAVMGMLDGVWQDAQYGGSFCAGACNAIIEAGKT